MKTTAKTLATVFLSVPCAVSFPQPGHAGASLATGRPHAEQGASMAASVAAFGPSCP